MTIKSALDFTPKRYSFLREELDNLQVGEIYHDLVEKLAVDLRGSGDHVLRDLIASCPNDLRKAGYCYAVAKEDNQKILDEFDKFYGKYEKKAQSTITALKKEGKWAGTTSKESIRAWIASNVSAAQPWFKTLRKSKEILDACKVLYKSYESRLSSLQTYSRLIEKRRGVMPGELKD